MTHNTGTILIRSSPWVGVHHRLVILCIEIGGYILQEFWLSSVASYQWTDRDCGCSRLSVGLNRLNVVGPHYPI